MAIPATRVIGITGTFLAGAGTASAMLSHLLGAPVGSYSDKIREVVRKRGLELARQNLHTVGNELRSKEPGVFSRMLDEDFSGKPIFIVEKLRSTGDYGYFRKKYGKQFILLAIDAPLRVRYNRALARSREGEAQLSLEEFKQSEEKEMKPDAKEWEMNIAGLMRLADYTIVNDGTPAELEEKLEKLVKEKLEK